MAEYQDYTNTGPVKLPSNGPFGDAAGIRIDSNGNVKGYLGPNTVTIPDGSISTPLDRFGQQPNHPDWQNPPSQQSPQKPADPVYGPPAPQSNNNTDPSGSQYAQASNDNGSADANIGSYAQDIFGPGTQTMLAPMAYAADVTPVDSLLGSDLDDVA